MTTTTLTSPTAHLRDPDADLYLACSGEVPHGWRFDRHGTLVGAASVYELSCDFADDQEPATFHWIAEGAISEDGVAPTVELACAKAVDAAKRHALAVLASLRVFGA